MCYLTNFFSLCGRLNTLNIYVYQTKNTQSIFMLPWRNSLLSTSVSMVIKVLMY